MPAGLYNPTSLLQDFVTEVGVGLSKVVTLDLNIQDMGGPSIIEAKLTKSLLALVRACHILTSFRSRGTLNVAFLQRLGEGCPSLSNLCMRPDSKDIANLLEIVQLLPFLLPKLSRLELPNYTSLTQLPDMTDHNRLVSLELDSFVFSSQSHWSCLPPKLQHLKCKSFSTVPPSILGQNCALTSLLTFQMEDAVIPLTLLAQLLQAAPSLQEIRPGDFALNGDFVVLCNISEADTPKDLQVLHSRMQASMSGKLGMILKQCVIQLDCNFGQTVPSLHLCIDNLPCMTYVDHCAISNIPGEVFEQLLEVFPNVQKLKLISVNLDDVGIQDLAACTRLSTLDLELCPNIRSVGLVTLCLHLPLLQLVRCGRCARLRMDELERCVLVLARHALVVEMVEVG